VQNQQIIMFWEHKFCTIMERFQQIFEKVESFRMDFQRLNEELKSVDSEEEWNEAKEHHEDYMEQLEEFTQELAGVIN
jgi:NurA-like 5'-3' nuclease